MADDDNDDKIAPRGFGSESAYMSACVPHMRSAGRSQQQAVAICLNRWRTGKGADVMETKASVHSIEIKQVDEKTGEFGGWASVFDKEDDGGDTVRRGAFEDSLKVRMPKIYVMHDTPVGILSVAEEKEYGLWVEGQPDSSRDGLDAREKLKSGALDALSIGYRTKVAKETGRLKRDLLKVDLYHVGLVPYGMLDQAVVTQVKALDLSAVKTIRDLERALRDAGWSKKASETLCSPGYIASLARGDPGDEVAELVRAIEACTSTLR